MQMDVGGSSCCWRLFSALPPRRFPVRCYCAGGRCPMAKLPGCSLGDSGLSGLGLAEQRHIRNRMVLLIELLSTPFIQRRISSASLPCIKTEPFVYPKTFLCHLPCSDRHYHLFSSSLCSHPTTIKALPRPLCQLGQQSPLRFRSDCLLHPTACFSRPPFAIVSGSSLPLQIDL